MTRRGRKLTPEHKEKLRQAALRRFEDPAEREKISAAIRRPDVLGARITRLRTNNERKKGPRWIEDEKTGCLVWQWGQSAVGYPSQGHRQAMYIFAKGPYPRGMQLHHHCHVRLCVNPDHQVPLTVTRHAALHASLRRHGYDKLPVPERIELSKRIIEGELVRQP